MIIQRIRSRNVLKYDELSIDLAERGLIAISGRNESGKSSIGEIVCFALFGRTFSVPPDEMNKVIRWGQDDCSVTLDFSVDDRDFTLSRSLDVDGNHGVRLALRNDPDNAIARGTQGVAEALLRIIGFEYEEFVESFYLAQREITTPHPHSQAVKIMAGLAPLERVMSDLSDEIDERQELLAEITTEWDAVDGDVKALGIQTGRLPQLENEHRMASEKRKQLSGLSGDIKRGIDACPSDTHQLETAQRDRLKARVLRVVSLVAAVALGGLWALLYFAAESSQAAVAQDLLGTYVPVWSDDQAHWIGILAVALVVAFIVLWIRLLGLRKRIEMLRERLCQLGAAFGQARQFSVGDTATSVEPGGETAAAVPLDLAADANAPTRPERAKYEALRGSLDRGESVVPEAQSYGESELDWLNFVGARLDHQIAKLDEAIADERARLQEAADLTEVLNGLGGKRDQLEERIGDRQRGLELLTSAIAHLSNKFNRDMKQLAGRMLPLFSDGRYQHLRIDEDLTVQVFSSEKLGFMDLDEVSSGTQRQIMLALRLALSKKLMSRRVRGKQFAFLDEPFAFFDQERTRRALQALSNLGDDISQVWIVAQDFPEGCEVDFDTTICCDGTSNTLQVAT